jgi:hypothetical protein
VVTALIVAFTAAAWILIMVVASRRLRGRVRAGYLVLMTACLLVLFGCELAGVLARQLGWRLSRGASEWDLFIETAVGVIGFLGTVAAARVRGSVRNA